MGVCRAESLPPRRGLEETECSLCSYTESVVKRSIGKSSADNTERES